MPRAYGLLRLGWFYLLQNNLALLLLLLTTRHRGTYNPIDGSSLKWCEHRRMNDAVHHCLFTLLSLGRVTDNRRGMNAVLHLI